MDLKKLLEDPNLFWFFSNLSALDWSKVDYRLNQPVWEIDLKPSVRKDFEKILSDGYLPLSLILNNEKYGLYLNFPYITMEERTDKVQEYLFRITKYNPELGLSEKLFEITTIYEREWKDGFPVPKWKTEIYVNKYKEDEALFVASVVKGLMEYVEKQRGPFFEKLPETAPPLLKE